MKDLYIKLFLALIALLLLLPNSYCNLISRKKNLEDVKEDIIMKNEIEKTIMKTQKLINNIEENEMANNEREINVNEGPDLEKLINEDEKKTQETFGNVNSNKKLMFFYTLSCPHSQAFLPIWYRIKNKLPSYVESEEVDCNDKSKQNICSNYQITGVPTLILVDDGSRYVYSGSRTESDIAVFLREHNVVMNQNEYEGFIDFNTNNLLEDMERRNSQIADMKCPTVTFDKYLDRTKEEYAFQIFDENGLYGYSKGGKNSYLDKFHAAYNCFDTYLSTLPKGVDVNECASKYRSQIRDFGLCDADKLNEMLAYGDRIKRGELNERVKDIDYDSNKPVINAIKKACSIA
jgi:thiol-disulfide isomerase/thioredoxin